MIPTVSRPVEVERRPVGPGHWEVRMSDGSVQQQVDATSELVRQWLAEAKKAKQ